MANVVDRLIIRLLGAPEALMAGTPLALHQQKARALLYYLAATGRPHTRDHLATLLWGEVPESNARHSLRSSLYHIRHALQARGAADALTGDNDLIRLDISPEACDVLYFRHLLVEGSEKALDTAVTLYRGPLLQGFTVTDAALFEEWSRFESSELAQMYLTALQKLASLAEASGAWSKAVAYVQRIVQLDPLSEESQQRLIGLYLRTQAIGQALRQYHRFEAELRHELGLAPSPTTRSLLSTALGTRLTSLLQKPSSIRTTRRVPQALPFVGRDESLRELLAVSRHIRTGRGSAVLLQGEDGSGRSRLLEELVGVLSQTDPPWLILQGSCSPFDDLLSYGPFLEALQNAGLDRLIDPQSEPGAADSSEQQRFLWNFLQVLRLLTHDFPLLLTIDDLQWANEPTLRLFGFLATRLRTLPVLLVGTARRVEAIPLLQQLFTLGRRRGDVTLLSLTPLTLAAVTTLLSSLGIETPSDSWASTYLAEWLYEKSGGSPFLLGEIIARLQAEEILDGHGDRLRLDVSRWRRWRTTFTLPETTHDLVAWRLTDLPTGARILLDVLAVANQPLPFKLLREFPGVESAQLLATVEALEARGLLVETANEWFALPHNLLRETLLHQMSYLRRQDIHRQLARIIEKCPALQQNFPLRQVALHAVAGEDGERARLYGLQALDELVRDNANAQTAAFLLHLHDLLAPIATPAEMLRLTSVLGQVYQSIGQLEEAAFWHRRHLELADKIADLPAVASAHFELGELALVANDYKTAASESRAGLSIGLPAEHPQIMALIARGHRLLGAALAMEGSDLPSAEHQLQQAVAAHRLTANMSDLCATLFELGNVAAQRGDLPAALQRYQEAAQTAEAAHIHYFLALAYNNFAYHSLLLGRPEDARQALTAGKKLAEQYEMSGALMHLSSTQGEIHLYLAEWQAATDAFQDSLTLAEELGSLERQAGNRTGLALAARGQGDLITALALLEEALALITEHGYWHLRTRIQLWLAETLIIDENLREADPHLATALATARAHDRKLLLLHGERLRAYLLAARGDWFAASELFSQTLERASNLHLLLEVARTKAIWGQALVHYTSSSHNEQVLLAEARQLFSAHNARADLEAIEQ